MQTEGNVKKDVSTQTEILSHDKGITCTPITAEAQVDCNFVESTCNREYHMQEPNLEESADYTDTSFILTQSEYSSSSEDDVEENCDSENAFAKDLGLMVYWQCLLTLLQRCLECGSPTIILKK